MARGPRNPRLRSRREEEEEESLGRRLCTFFCCCGDDAGPYAGGRARSAHVESETQGARGPPRGPILMNDESMNTPQIDSIAM